MIQSSEALNDALVAPLGTTIKIESYDDAKYRSLPEGPFLKQNPDHLQVTQRYRTGAVSGFYASQSAWQPGSLDTSAIEASPCATNQSPLCLSLRTPSSILKSSAEEMERSTRMLALTEQLEDELKQLKIQRSEECSRLQNLLQKREEEVAELKARKLSDDARLLGQEAVNTSWAERVAQLEAEIKQMSEEHQQDLNKLQSRLKQCEEESARARLRHDEEANRLQELLKEHQNEIAELRAQLFVADRQRSNNLDLDQLRLAVVNAEAENMYLKSELHEKKWKLERVEAQAEKNINDSIEFVKRLAVSSAGANLQQSFDLRSAEFLGMGNYGYVMTCKSKKTNSSVVLKLQSERWVGLALTEWAHGHEVGCHPNIVEHLEVVMHRDADGELRRRLNEAFDHKVLTGKRPKFFPDTFFCLAIEYMDRGCLQNFMDKKLLTVECMAAVTYQIASGLAFMHKKKRTHNDIKPENILLCADPAKNCLLAKLADLGLAEHSLDRRRDNNLYAYTIWCMGLNRTFERCPQEPSDKANACKLFASEMPHDKLWSAISFVIEGLWQNEDRFSMFQVTEMPVLQGLSIRTPEQKTSGELETLAKRSIRTRQTQRLETFKLTRSTLFPRDEDDDA